MEMCECFDEQIIGRCSNRNVKIISYIFLTLVEGTTNEELAHFDYYLL